MKKLSICIACYNEVGNIEELVSRIKSVMEKEKDYTYEILIADNDSRDGTQDVLRKLAQEDKQVKVIINNRNYGPRLSPKNMLRHVTGDVQLSIAGDLQDPPELIPQFLREWESGYKMVYGQKTSSEEGKIKYGFRHLFYDIIQIFSSKKIYKHISGICLNDIEVVREILSADPDVSIHVLIPEMGYELKLIQYVQNKRKSGKSSYNLDRYFDYAINALISGSTKPVRLVTVIGMVMSFIMMVVAVFYFVSKILFWNRFSAGIAPIVIGVFFFGALQLFITGLIGEYVCLILKRVTKQLPVIEKELINFEE